MSLVAFDQLPDHARLWIFAADRPLADGERDRLVDSVESGLAAWSAHGSPVSWGHTLVHDQFLLIAVDETHTALSGCSIDSAMHRVAELEKQLGISFLDHGRVFYRKQDAVAVADRSGFRALAETGEVDASTVVFNNVLQTLGEWRAGGWEVPARDSWHARAFPLTPA